MTEQPEHNTRARPNTHHAFSVHALPGALDLHGVVQAGLCLDDNGEVGRHVLAHKVVVAELGRMPAGHARQPLASSRSGAAPLGAAARACRATRARRGSAGPRAVRCAGLWRGCAAARCFRPGSGAARMPARRARHGRGGGAGLLCSALMLFGLGRRDEACEGVCGAVQQPAARDRAFGDPLLATSVGAAGSSRSPPLSKDVRPGASRSPGVIDQAGNAQAPLEVWVALQTTD